MYDSETGEWKYSHPLEIRQPYKKPIKRKVKTNPPRSPRRSEAMKAEQHRSYLVRKGVASKIPIRTTLEEALKIAGF